ncbi:MAG TPA: hypothetical protein VFE50_22710 [Cyclobacteriaceae bacterium]|nr:hypothetical protein [Cyclobacteriaceae bacterium]
MDILQPAGGIIGLVAYVLLIVALTRSTSGGQQSDTEQSFAAFFLWALLDLIATITTIIEGGNYWLALSNAIGSSVITIILVYKKQVSWSWVESMTATLVVVCLVVWYVSGEQAGIVASSLAVVIASVPQMVDTFKKPGSTPLLPYMVFLVANIISFLAGKSWTIEERFYQACGIFLVVVIVAFALRRRSPAS